MRTRVLTAPEVLAGYDATSALYPFIPSLSHWRAWEYAAYRHHRLSGRILDLGCGDGRYFRLIWPKAASVVGVDMDARVAAHAEQSGVYERVHVTGADRLPEDDQTFDHVFANCSLEHMDSLGSVLSEIRRVLKPGGTLLCSVVTQRFVEWALLPHLAAQAGFERQAKTLAEEFLKYHHLCNALTVPGWLDNFARAGLNPEEHTPILPKHNSGLFLLMDNLWHIPRSGGGELGDAIYLFLSANPKFPRAFRKVFAGFLEMETDWQDCSGAVFFLRKHARHA